MLRNDIDRALKIFETGVGKLKLESEQEQSLLSCNNRDISVFLFNYAKCILLKRGQGCEGLNFCKSDLDTVKIFEYLHKMKSRLGRIFFEERKLAEAMFDSAVAGLWWIVIILIKWSS